MARCWNLAVFQMLFSYRQIYLLTRNIHAGSEKTIWQLRNFREMPRILDISANVLSDKIYKKKNSKQRFILKTDSTQTQTDMEYFNIKALNRWLEDKNSALQTVTVFLVTFNRLLNMKIFVYSHLRARNDFLRHITEIMN